MIYFDADKQIFHLTNGQVSYIIGVEEKGLLAHLYYGKAVSGYHGGRHYPRFERSFSFNFEEDKKRVYSRDTLLQEISSFGGGDFRVPSLDIAGSDGSHQTDFRYDSYEIYKGKPDLGGLPATFASEENPVETLDICLKDKYRQLALHLRYSIFEQLSVITRSHIVVNEGRDEVVIHKLSSLSLDFPADKWESIHLPGAWGNERQLQRDPLVRGIHTFDSKRGTSSHQENPFVALVKNDTTENQGLAYGFALVYSGNHEETIEVDQYQQVRLTMGINSFGFVWHLSAGVSFTTPEVVMVYSDQGLNRMSQIFHTVVHKHLTRGVWKDKERPILINNWEATYFDFDTDSIKGLMDEASQLGMELFVLDDGWFGQREDDQTSLGDWFVNEDKLQGGLQALATYAKSKNLDFGLWFEPEMISRSSQLFEAHPDWYLHHPGYEAATSRSQFVLNLSRDDVTDYVIETLSTILRTVDISYVKWDMNRYLSDIYATGNISNHGEVAHRYVLNLYRIFEHLLRVFPHILFEGCSGGGGRFDMGILHYMPQIWTSDNSDAIARLKIQYGTSLAYPVSSMGAHVSAVPNHQNGRITSIETRFNIAMTGAFGYELDPRQLSSEEKAIIKDQVAFYKKNRQLLQYGTFTRLTSPFETNACAWQLVSKDKNQAMVIYTTVLSHAAPPLQILKVKGLEASSLYYCQQTEQCYYGDELAEVGFYIHPIFNQKDFDSRRIDFVKVEDLPKGK